MIVLDEQLLGRHLEDDIRHWYRGRVCFITDLRPGTVIKDEAIPLLLRQHNQPTFVTINTRDFWKRVPIGRNFGVICIEVSDAEAAAVSDLLRRLFRLPEFRSRSRRMGKVVRLTADEIQWYTAGDRTVRRTGGE